MFVEGRMPDYRREIRGTGDFYYHKSDYAAQSYADTKKTIPSKERPVKYDIFGKHYLP